MSFATALRLIALFLLSTACQAANLTFVTQDLQPFSYEENGKAAGPMVDILRAVCTGLDQACNIIMAPLRRGEYGLDYGDYDGMLPLIATRQRQDTYFMVQSILTTSGAFIARTDSQWTYDGPHSLDGKTIGVFGPSGSLTTLEELVKKTSTARFEVELSNGIVLRKLAGGRYGTEGVGFANRDVALALIAKQGAAGLRFAGDGPTMAYTIALSKKTVPDALARQFDETLTALKASGKLREILARYHLQDRLAP